MSEREPNQCIECFAPVDPESYRARCFPCLQRMERAALLDDFAKARKVPLAEYSGAWVTVSTPDDEDNIVEIDAIPHEAEFVHDDGTRWVWGVESVKAHFDLSDVLDGYLQDEHHEDARDWVDESKILEAQAAVDAALAKVESYREDRSVAVVMPAEAQ